MIQILLHGLKMDPLVSLHYYAPVCAVINLSIIPFTEGLAPFYEVMRLGSVSRQHTIQHSETDTIMIALGSS